MLKLYLKTFFFFILVLIPTRVILTTPCQKFQIVALVDWERMRRVTRMTRMSRRYDSWCGAKLKSHQILKKRFYFLLSIFLCQPLFIVTSNVIVEDRETIVYESFQFFYNRYFCDDKIVLSGYTPN